MPTNAQNAPHLTPPKYLRLDTGALVSTTWPITYWWQIDAFLDTRDSWFPEPEITDKIDMSMLRKRWNEETKK